MFLDRRVATEAIATPRVMRDLRKNGQAQLVAYLVSASRPGHEAFANNYCSDTQQHRQAEREQCVAEAV